MPKRLEGEPSSTSVRFDWRRMRASAGIQAVVLLRGPFYARQSTTKQRPQQAQLTALTGNFHLGVQGDSATRDDRGRFPLHSGAYVPLRRHTRDDHPIADFGTWRRAPLC